MLLRKYIEEDSARLSLWAPIAVGAGIVLYLSLPAMPDFWFLPASLVAALLLLGLASRLQVYRWPVVGAVMLLIGMAMADASVRYDGTPMLRRDIGVREVQGVVRDIEPQAHGVRLIIATDSIERMAPADTPLRVRLSYRLKDAPPPIGATVSCRAKLMAISPPVVPGGYDFRRHNYFNHIGATGFVVSACSLVATPGTGRVAEWASQGRLYLRTAVDKVLDGDEAAITEALLTGVQQGITEGTMESMRVSGLVHILSVSGLHIGLAAGILFFVIRALLALVPYIALRWPIKKIAAIAALVSAIAYTLLVGAPIPAVRSLLMTGLVLLAVLLDRQALTLRVVAVAALGVMVLSPASVLSPSFQMSFAAVAAIVAMIESTEGWRQNWLEKQGWLTRAGVYLLATAATSLAATLATLPFTYYHFQQLNIYGVIANMLAMPLASFWLMPLAVLCFIALPLGLHEWPLALMGEGVHWLIAIANGVASLPGADWRVPYMPDAALLLMMLGGLWLLIWRARWRWWGIAPMLLAVLMGLFVPLPKALVSDDGKIAFLQKDAGEYVLVSSKRIRDDNFIIEQWSRYLGIRHTVAADESGTCDAAACSVRTVVLLRDPNALPEWCNADDITLLVPLIGAGPCNAAIDRWTLYRGGAAMVKADGSVETVAASVGDWPWSRFRFTQRP